MEEEFKQAKSGSKLTRFDQQDAHHKSDLQNLLLDLNKQESTAPGHDSQSSKSQQPFGQVSEVERAFANFIMQSPSKSTVHGLKDAEMKTQNNCIAPTHETEEHRKQIFSNIKQIVIAAYLWEGKCQFSNIDASQIVSGNCKYQISQV